jgi:hypothetical protein
MIRFDPVCTRRNLLSQADIGVIPRYQLCGGEGMPSEPLGLIPEKPGKTCSCDCHFQVSKDPNKPAVALFCTYFGYTRLRPSKSAGPPSADDRRTRLTESRGDTPAGSSSSTSDYGYAVTQCIAIVG